ncbi:hypothetical protein [Pseudomonas syringae pv. coryli]|uniref:hypothetical protein n=1 Tax=Pseudomonas syringae pv. coryli TaxID=317659 RepID=UPI003D26AFDC
MKSSDNPKEHGHFLLLANSDAKPHAFNPLVFARRAPEFLVQFLESCTGVKLGEKPKQALFTILEDLPDNASMLDLMKAITAHEAASLGLSVDQYEALSPLFAALKHMQSEGLYVALLVNKEGITTYPVADVQQLRDLPDSVDSAGTLIRNSIKIL